MTTKRSAKVVALMTGRGGSRSIKNKNVYPVLGRPLLAYPILAAQHSHFIDDIYMSTDSELLANEAERWGAKIIMRPDELGVDTKHAEAIVHGYNSLIQKGVQVDILVILMANCPTISSQIIDQGIQILIDDKEESYDSCMTVSKYNEYNPMRARVVRDGLLEPMVEASYFREKGFMKNESGHDRDGIGDILFCDGGAFIVRPRCMDLSHGSLPIKWIGQKVVPLIQEYGADVDNERCLANAEFWLRRNGFSEDTTPYDKKEVLGVM